MYVKKSNSSWTKGDGGSKFDPREPICVHMWGACVCEHEYVVCVVWVCTVCVVRYMCVACEWCVCVCVVCGVTCVYYVCIV